MNCVLGYSERCLRDSGHVVCNPCKTLVAAWRDKALRYDAARFELLAEQPESKPGEQVVSIGLRITNGITGELIGWLPDLLTLTVRDKQDTPEQEVK